MLLVPLEVLPHRAGWGRKPLVGRVQSRVGTVQQHHRDIRQRVRCALVELQPTAHAQQVIERDLSPLVRLPFRHRDRPLDREPALLHQNADQRVGDRFGHRPAEEGRVRSEPLGIALGDDVPIAHDDDGPGASRPFGIGFGKGPIEHGAQRVVRRNGGIDSLARSDMRRDLLHRVGSEPDGAAAALTIDSFLADHPGDARGDASGFRIDRGGHVLQRRQVIDLQFLLHDLWIATSDEHFRAEHLRFVGDEDRCDARRVHDARRDERRDRDQSDTPSHEPRHLTSASRALTSRFTSATGSGLSRGN